MTGDQIAWGVIGGVAFILTGYIIYNEIKK